jgi:hypothetical protein
LAIISARSESKSFTFVKDASSAYGPPSSSVHEESAPSALHDRLGAGDLLLEDFDTGESGVGLYCLIEIEGVVRLRVESGLPFLLSLMLALLNVDNLRIGDFRGGGDAGLDMTLPSALCLGMYAK